MPFLVLLWLLVQNGRRNHASQSVFIHAPWLFWVYLPVYFPPVQSYHLGHGSVHSNYHQLNLINEENRQSSTVDETELYISRFWEKLPDFPFLWLHVSFLNLYLMVAEAETYHALFPNPVNHSSRRKRTSNANTKLWVMYGLVAGTAPRDMLERQIHLLFPKLLKLTLQSGTLQFPSWELFQVILVHDKVWEPLT